jgi:transposase
MAVAKSHSQSVLPNPRSLVLESIEQSDDTFLLSVHVEQVPSCPECGRPSHARHSSYRRRLQDLPWQGLSVQIFLRVRRFRCRNHSCPRHVFTERIQGIPSYLRQTSRLAEMVRMVGYAAGGLPGARLLARLAIRTSDDTVLRRVKAAVVRDADESIEVLGVDDWAWRKGQSYGTILVDLNRRSVRDLLADRSAQSFQAWLQQQPEIRIISRDRGGIYAEGAERGALADRFHLFLNLSAAVERSLEPRRQELCLRDAAVEQTEGYRGPQESKTRQQILQQQRRQHRVERYEKVIECFRQGYSQKKIGSMLHLDRRTVRRWIRAGVFPERQSNRQRPTQVRRFEEYLQRRWGEGCHNATRLFQELRTLGYLGGRSMVAQHVAHWRKALPPFSALRTQKISPKQAALLVTRPAARLTAEQQALLDRLSTQCPTLLRLREFSGEFRGVFQKCEGPALPAWILRAQDSGIGPLARFAAGLQKDFSAVAAAVESPWSNGQVEGQINRLKTLKRQMYGRAGFALLRARVLPYVPLRTGDNKAA